MPDARYVFADEMLASITSLGQAATVDNLGSPNGLLRGNQSKSSLVYLVCHGRLKGSIRVNQRAIVIVSQGINMVIKGSQRYMVRQGNLLERLFLRAQVNDGRVTRPYVDTLRGVTWSSVEISGMTG